MVRVVVLLVLVLLAPALPALASEAEGAARARPLLLKSARLHQQIAEVQEGRTFTFLYSGDTPVGMQLRTVELDEALARTLRYAEQAEGLLRELRAGILDTRAEAGAERALTAQLELLDAMRRAIEAGDSREEYRDADRAYRKALEEAWRAGP